MEKVRMKIVAIDEQENRNEITTLTIKAKSKDKIYIFAVKEEDYLDEKKRKGFHQDWLKTIKKSQVRAGMSKKNKEIKRKKVQDMIGSEVEEIVY